MNKARLEALSDGIFAVAMTLLVFDLKVPAYPSTVTNFQLWHALSVISPHILVFAGTFIVLSTMWINHHFLFRIFAREEQIARSVNLVNLIYLLFVAFVPFSASFIGAYAGNQPAVILYGANLLAITALSILIIVAIHRTQGTEHLSERILQQSRFRSLVNIVCYLLGIVVSFWSTYVSLFLYIFPVIFNFIPGTLNFTEHLFGFTLGAIDED